MSASDLDISIEKKIKTENAETGSIVVPSKLFGDIIRKLPEGDIFIEEDEGKIVIKRGGFESVLVGFPADEFPNVDPNEEAENKIVFEKEVIKDMIAKTSFAASIDENKGVITGVLIESEEKSLNMVAIDGFRMAITRRHTENEKKENVVISAKILNDISKIISESGDESDTVDFFFNKKKAIFVMEDTKVVLRLLEGEFMNYRRILPAENSTRIVLNRNDFMSSIERASLFAKVGKNNLVRLDIKENMMEITSKSEEGNVREEVMISKEGNDMVIGFNSKYLLDALRNIEDESISLLLNGSISPCLIKPLEGDYFEYLILPVRLGQ